MPRAPSITKEPNSLKRNQACHQCRKRKLKCDAGHPCATCVRSHAFAMRSAQSSTQGPMTIPPIGCTYDDSLNDSWQDSSSTAKLTKMEDKIAALEAQLREAHAKIQDQENGSNQSASKGEATIVGGGPTLAMNTEAGTLDILLPDNLEGTSPSATISPAASPFAASLQYAPSTPSEISSARSQRPQRSNLFAPHYVTTRDEWCTVVGMDAIGALDGIPDPLALTVHLSNLDQVTNEPRNFYNPTLDTHLPSLTEDSDTDFVFGKMPQNAEPSLYPSMAPIHEAWPQYLPPPELLLHLVDTFFTCLPHAGRILHRGTLMNSLTYPPNAPQFPLPALLHSICAVASFYTAIVDPPVLPSVEEILPEEVFKTAKVPDAFNPSFGETHAMWATLAGARAIQAGDKMLQVIQSTVILSWFQYTSGSSVNVWILVGKACRISAPLGINVSSAYGTLSRFNRMPTLIHPPRNAIEAEERRNLFWLIYALERFHTAGTCWSMLLDDEDISQFIPLGDEDFNAGKPVPDQLRQRLASPNVLLEHPHEITSAFSLFIKSTVLLSKVKVFNVRFRTKYGDSHGDQDPRDTAEFQELDKLLWDFKDSWPREFRDPVSVDGKVDPTLYLASIVPYTATMILHDPHPNFESPNCQSVQRLRQACATVMDSIYRLCSTSFDVLLLDHVTSFCWFVLGACLTRFLKASISSGNTVDAIRLNSEIEVVKHVLAKLGERTTIGRRQIRLLNELYASELGKFGLASSQFPESLFFSVPSRQKPGQGLNATALTVNQLIGTSAWRADPSSATSQQDVQGATLEAFWPGTLLSENERSLNLLSADIVLPKHRMR